VSHTRREFNKLAGLGIGSLLLPESIFVPFAKPSMALQLWTVRDLIKEDLEGTIHHVATIGFSAVETAFFPELVTLEKSSAVIQDSGMDVCSIHTDIPVGDNKNKILEMAEAYKSKRIVWHGWPEDDRYETIKGIDELAQIYNEANAFLKENDLQFGLHNHWWEFRKMDDERLPFDVLKEKMDQDIFFEIDTYWTKVAGQDPAEIIAKYGERVPLLHIKDGPAKYSPFYKEVKPEPMVAVGQGNQNFPAISKARGSNAKWWIVELDECATDMFTAVEESYMYLKKSKLARGKI